MKDTQSKISFKVNSNREDIVLLFVDDFYFLKEQK